MTRIHRTFSELIQRDQAHLEAVKGKSDGPRGPYKVKDRDSKPLSRKQKKLLAKLRPRVPTKTQKRHRKWLESLDVEI